MNKTVADFIGAYLHVEVAYEDLGPTRELIAALSPEYAGSLEEGFERLLRSRGLAAADYDGMTHIEFESDDALYRYLQGVYDYLFRGAGAQPRPPR
ncbi:hypothetical protein KGA66_00735 [Actinocrinis puniceicyclus]|uniref:CdiI immunity protein domain-containing protein n=1 Tax=Actinocrinis puniceicyclus TaxID=977794 RepID=A0A8J8BAY3_9ACTN|nr:hypothetical protein [Actinocrinis puniceicyclus]MBS2961551.1 hypothetical protein [Actinocrinis puniceicyclus]